MATELSTEETTKARVQLFAKDMMKQINNNWSNGAILINKYGQNCKDIIMVPEKRLLYWLEQK